MKSIKTAPIGLSVFLSTLCLAGCGSHDRAAQMPAGMKVGHPLTAAQVEDLDQKYQAKKQRQGQ